MIDPDIRVLRVFLSYRRSDDRHLAGRLRDVLAHEYGDANVFFDVDSIAAGADFRDAIRDCIDHVDVMLVLIGRHWEPERLNVATDPVRMELVEAFRHNTPVIPILIDDTPMPTPDGLPDDLARLAYLNACVVRPDPDFRGDTARLTRAVRAAAEHAAARRQLPTTDKVAIVTPTDPSRTGAHETRPADHTPGRVAVDTGETSDLKSPTGLPSSDPTRPLPPLSFTPADPRTGSAATSTSDRVLPLTRAGGPRPRRSQDRSHLATVTIGGLLVVAVVGLVVYLRAGPGTGAHDRPITSPASVTTETAATSTIAPSTTTSPVSTSASSTSEPTTSTDAPTSTLPHPSAPRSPGVTDPQDPDPSGPPPGTVPNTTEPSATTVPKTPPPTATVPNTPPPTPAPPPTVPRCPSVTGSQYDAARNALAAAGCTETHSLVNDLKTERGTVLTQTQGPYTTQVVLRVATGGPLPS